VPMSSSDDDEAEQPFDDSMWGGKQDLDEPLDMSMSGSTEMPLYMAQGSFGESVGIFAGKDSIFDLGEDKELNDGEEEDLLGDMEESEGSATAGSPAHHVDVPLAEGETISGEDPIFATSADLADLGPSSIADLAESTDFGAVHVTASDDPTSADPVCFSPSNFFPSPEPGMMAAHNGQPMRLTTDPFISPALSAQETRGVMSPSTFLLTSAQDALFASPPLPPQRSGVDSILETVIL